jgi:hypothetical protein
MLCRKGGRTVFSRGRLGCRGVAYRPYAIPRGFLGGRQPQKLFMKPAILAIFLQIAAVAQAAQNGQFIYAAQDDGTVHVYDINNAHALVKTLTFFAGDCDTRGIIASHLGGDRAAIAPRPTSSTELVST